MLKKPSSFKPALYGILLTLLMLVFLISLSMGKYSVSPAELIRILGRKLLGMKQTWPDTVDVALFNIRIPRVLVAGITGGALASAGAVYQGLFRNPMVSPDLLGSSAGAGFGAALAIILGLNIMGVHVLSFVFGLLAVFLCYSIARIVNRGNNMLFSLILTGMVVSTMFTSLVSVTKFVADPTDKLPAITFWLMGGLNSVIASKVPLLTVPFLIGLVPMLLLRWQMNVISFGDDEARALGTNVRQIRLLMIVCATLLTASTVAIAGMIGWIGLVIPHVTRMLAGNNYKDVIPASVIIGAIFMMIIDDVARCAFPVEVPLGILTGLIGGPFFLYLLFQGRSRSEA